MKAHRSLSRADVLKYSPEKVALMVASEFWRASDVAAHPENVAACLARAAELLDILSAMDLPEPMAASVRPLHVACRPEVLAKVAAQPTDQIRDICSDFAQRFDLLGTIK